eukprot:TRINITY_DN4409_c0_g3_i1.p1 TRINITY_DN4409_c0_g3~~TRINITY_DN4409_c0_g3_i1.p1  ORF type:complete len:373 (-),score=51.14 TRINITY_DN4409_c0_g3_i1:440-1531(-)
MRDATTQAGSAQGYCSISSHLNVLQVAPGNAMCKWYCTSEGPSTNLTCLSCGCHYCGACLHGDAGKMESLVKCLRCGKKPQVKPNAERSAWSSPAGCDKGERLPQAGTPMSRSPSTGEEMLRTPSKEQRSPSKPLYGPERFFYDKSSYTGMHAKGGPDHVAKGGGSTVDSSWKRPDAGANMGSAAEKPESRTPTKETRSSSKGMYGPERFFYDKSSYTGSHAKGGPDHVAKGCGSSGDFSWKRPDSSGGNSEVVVRRPSKEQVALGGPTLLNRRSRRSGRSATDLVQELVDNSKHEFQRPGSRGGADAGSRAATPGEGIRKLVGPERFFYDKSTYTGCHTKGGPSSVAKGGGSAWDQSWKRPS